MKRIISMLTVIAIMLSVSSVCGRPPVAKTEKAFIIHQDEIVAGTTISSNNMTLEVREMSCYLNVELTDVVLTETVASPSPDVTEVNYLSVNGNYCLIRTPQPTPRWRDCIRQCFTELTG